MKTDSATVHVVSMSAALSMPSSYFDPERYARLSASRFARYKDRNSNAAASFASVLIATFAVLSLARLFALANGSPR